MAVVQALDVQRLAGVHHRRLGDIFRLVDRDRRQGSQSLRYLAHQLPGALMGCCGDLHQREALGLHMGAEPLQIFRVGHNVHLVGGYDLGPLGEIGAVLLQLGVDGVKIRHRVPALAAGHVYHMNQQTAAVDVPQEIVAQTGALTGAFDDAGNVSHDEGHALVHPHHAQIGIEGGKVVIGDLGLGLGDHAQQCGLAHIGETDEAHVRQQLQLQKYIVALAGQARLGEARHLPGGGGEVHIAPAAPAALAEDIGLAAAHVLNDLIGFGVPHQRAPGDADHQIGAVLAGLAAALTVHAVFCHVFALVAEVHQGGHVVIHLQDNGAALAAVAAVRAAGRHIFFPVERHCAVTAVACPDRDPGLVDKCCCHKVPLNSSVKTGFPT